jgi:hypothetical protein
MTVLFPEGTRDSSLLQKAQNGYCVNRASYFVRIEDALPGDRVGRA